MENYNFSVAICVYNGDNPEWFRTAMESIFNQSLVPNEVVLVVDGPVNDRINAVISDFENADTVKVIRMEENLGHGIARRTGFQNCSNDLIALMDADDICAYDRFEKQIQVFIDYDVDVTGGNIAEFIGDVNNIVAYRVVPQNDEEIKQYIKYRCPFNQMTVMMKKDKYNIAGGYLDWYCDEDYYLWLRMLLKDAKFYNIQDVLVNVRVGEDMYKRRGGIRYFRSEAKLQKYMLKEKIINPIDYIMNVTKRFIVQVMLPNNIRGFVFKHLARSKSLK